MEFFIGSSMLVLVCAFFVLMLCMAKEVFEVDFSFITRPFRKKTPEPSDVCSKIVEDCNALLESVEALAEGVKNIPPPQPPETTEWSEWVIMERCCGCGHLQDDLLTYSDTASLRIVDREVFCEYTGFHECCPKCGSNEIDLVSGRWELVEYYYWSKSYCEDEAGSWLNLFRLGESEYKES